MCGTMRSRPEASLVLPAADHVAPGDFFGNITIGSLTSSRELGYLDSKVGMRTFQAKIRFDF